MIKVTICIPFYNDVNYLENSIQSVINQTYENWNLLLLDDGSTDGSLEIAKSFLRDPRVKLITDGQNLGLVARLNQSIDLISTKYYARMDADDIMLPSRIEEQINILETNTDIDVLGSTAYSLDKFNNIKGLKKDLIGHPELVKVKTFIHPTIIAKTEWLKKYKYKAYAKRMEDMELWYRSSDSSNFYAINKPLIFYREYGGSYYRKYKLVAMSLFLMSFNHSKSMSESFHWFQLGILSLPKYLLFKIFSLFNKESVLISRRYNSLPKKVLDYLNVVLMNALIKNN